MGNLYAFASKQSDDQMPYAWRFPRGMGWRRSVSEGPASVFAQVENQQPRERLIALWREHPITTRGCGGMPSS